MMRRLEAYQSIVPLLLRVGVGLTFFMSGLGKVMGGTDGVAKFFGSLGIPLPGLMGPFISYLELLGGLALMLGLFTRVFAILFICDMLVALLLVNIPAVAQAKSIADGFPKMRTEWLLLLCSASLATLGAGLWSLDAAFFRSERREMVEPARRSSVA
jgi:putative oxidoreductase